MNAKRQNLSTRMQQTAATAYLMVPKPHNLFIGFGPKFADRATHLVESICTPYDKVKNTIDPALQRSKPSSAQNLLMFGITVNSPYGPEHTSGDYTYAKQPALKDKLHYLWLAIVLSAKEYKRYGN